MAGKKQPQPPRKGFVYALLLEGGPVRYVGQSSNPERRLDSISDPRAGRSANPLLRAWVMRNLGRVRLSILEACDDMDAREMYWIAFHRAVGDPLLNLEPGGRSTPATNEKSIELLEQLIRRWDECRTPPDEADRLIAADMLRRSRETRERIKPKRPKKPRR